MSESDGSGTGGIAVMDKKAVHVPLTSDQKQSVLTIMGLFPKLEWGHILKLGIKDFLSFRPWEAQTTISDSMAQALFEEIQRKWGIDPIEVYLETLDQMNVRLIDPELARLNSSQLEKLEEKTRALLATLNELKHASKRKER